MAVQITTALDLLEIVPVVLGHQPTESLVALVFDEDTGRVSHGMRVDVDAAITQPDELTRQITEQNAPVVLAAFAAIQDTGREALTRVLAAGVTPAAAPALASIDGWTWIDPDHPDTTQWTQPWDDEDTKSARTALRTQADVPWPEHTEADLAERYGSTPDEAAQWAGTLATAITEAANGPAGEARQDRRIRHQHELAQWVTSHLGQTITADQAAYAVARVSTDPAIRDAAWVLITTSEAGAHLDLWHQVANQAGPGQEALAPLYLAAMAALIDRQTVTARIIRERGQLIPGSDQYPLGFLDQLSRIDMRTYWNQARPQMYRTTFGHDPDE